MNENDVFESSEKIVNSVSKALESGDFSNLSKDVKNVVINIGTTNNYAHSTRSSWESEAMTPFFSTKIKQGKGKGKIIGGSILAGLFFFAILGSKGIADCWFEILMFLLGAFLILTGIKQRKLVKDYNSFGQIIGRRSFITVKELSDKTGKAPNYIVHQIDRMKSGGYLPYASMDRGKTTLMLTDEVYKEYLRVAMNNEGQDDASFAASETEETPMFEELKIDKKLPEEAKAILRDGNEYLKKIRYFNDLIPDTETMSDKLYDLEKTALSIFKNVKEDPELARKNQLRRLMTYYVPTSEKLLQKYVDMRNSSQGVENIAKSQKDIEEATDALNKAFTELLNQLFESTSSDISADISVMKTWMQQDALTE